MTYDQNVGKVLLFGGLAGAGSVADTWEFSGGSWTQLSPTNSPTARLSSAMAYDPPDKIDVLFGGIGHTVSSPPIFGDTWEFSSGSWAQD